MTQRNLLTALVAFLSIASAAAWWTYEEGSQLLSEDSSVLYGMEDKHVALVKFDKPDFGDCSVQHAWIEKTLSVTTRHMFGRQIGSEAKPVALVYVLLKPVGEYGAPPLELIDKRSRSWFVGASGYWTAATGTRMWVSSTRTDFPTPDLLEFRCEAALTTASVQYK